MKRIAIILLIAFAAWASPIHAASAEESPPLFSMNDIPPEQRPPFVEVNGIIQHDSIPIPTPPSIISNPERKAVVSGKLHEQLDSGRNYSKEEVQALIISYSNQYGINPATPLCIAQKESGFNPNAKNRNSSASGVFQYLSTTWRGTDEAKAGRSVMDADANVKAAVKYMAIHKSTKPWVVRTKCPSLSLS